MTQSNGQPLSQPDGGKPKGNYTGERLKALRPETYRKVVELLAEPREHVSYREICRQCHVTDDTVKAVERREAISIATRKEALMVQAARIAKRAYDRVEDQIDSAPLPQAVVTAGVFTDKLQLLSGDVTSASYPLTFTLMPSILLRNLTSYTTQSELKRRPSKHRAKRLKARLVCRAAKKPDKKLHPLLLGAELLAEYLPNRLHFRAFSYATVRNRQFAKLSRFLLAKLLFRGADYSCARRGSNPQPTAPEAVALSN